MDQLYNDEMAALLREVTGATFTMMLGGGKKRYGESATDLLARSDQRQTGALCPCR